MLFLLHTCSPGSLCVIVVMVRDKDHLQTEETSEKVEYDLGVGRPNFLSRTKISVSRTSGWRRPSRNRTHLSGSETDKEVFSRTERRGYKSKSKMLPVVPPNVHEDHLVRHMEVPQVINDTWCTPEDAASCTSKRKEMLLDLVKSFFDGLYKSAIGILKKTRPFWLEYHTDRFVQPPRFTVNMLHSSTHHIQPGPHKPVVSAPSRVDNIDMVSELVRYGTFHSWSNPAAWPNRLAAAGFYYRNQGDEVVCFSCGCTCSDWQQGVEPMVVHRRLAPSCRFVNGHAENIPVIESQEAKNYLIQVSGCRPTHNPPAIVHTSPMTQQSQPRHPQTTTVANTAGLLSLPPPSRYPGEATSAPLSLSPAQIATPTTPAVAVPPSHVQTHSSPPQPTRPTEKCDGSILGINTDRPQHPTYAVTSTRVKSYTSWPHTSHTPVQLAEAGFFHTGQGDSVRCFFCGTGLRNWDSGDNPWVEHARWSPQCVYLVQHQGRDFVDLVQSLTSGGNQVEYSQVQDILRDTRPAAAPQKQQGVDAGTVAPVAQAVGEVTGDALGDEHEDDSLVEENERLKQQTMCKICLDKEVSIVFLPCGHLVCCVECAPALRKCPMCRGNIRGTVRAFMS
ncbi:baculoviral IAP repeat-containing protein 7-A-like [Haliotis cracherodii]|uniref:baculoviral IAP repeat-containing protein 7-A-like n=1 Tax=Haliotis cracherodii TaxID=6455 RepID=UPI0039E9F52F